MKKVFYVVIVITILWYMFLFGLLNRPATNCDCAPLSETDYQGADWPSLLPDGGCGCEPNSEASDFFLELFTIIFPGGLILLIYFIYGQVKKIMN